MKSYYYLFVVSVIYLLFRFGWTETIQFGYDQPRLASTVMNFLSQGSYLTSQNFVLESPWGNISWGPSLIFFFSLVLKISSDPLVASRIVAFLNLISVFAVFYIGLKFFSLRVGVVAGLILSLHPWWIIFSRMVYQPSFVPSLISLSMLLTFLTLKKPKSLFSGFLIFSWSLLIQFYLSTLSFIVTSAIFLMARLKKISIYWIFFGLALSAIVFVPTVYFFANNPQKTLAFFLAPGKFHSTTKDVVINYFKTVSGENFEWELGYGYRDFIKTNSWTDKVFAINFLLVGSIILYTLFKLFKKSKDRELRLVLLLWSIAPVWFLSLVKVEYVVPRYFLISLPPISLLIGLFVDDTLMKIKNTSLLIPAFLILSWALLIVRYYDFLEKYDYPNGFLSHFSDIPYSFLQRSFNFMGPDKPERGLWAVNYYLDYIDDKKSGKVLYEISFDAPDKQKTISARFGPYTIYKIRN
jgi:hypothetical protein